MKLISLNVEGIRNSKTVFSFLAKEQADAVCLQEATKEDDTFLRNNGYNTTFLPRCSKEQDGIYITDGELIATKAPHTMQSFYYHTHTPEIPIETFDPVTERLANNQGVIVCTFTHNDEPYTLTTTHFTRGIDGSTATQAQCDDLDVLSQFLMTLPAHILCGDFNIPRLHNPLYKVLAAAYTDEIPVSYTSSLDRDIHRVGGDPEKEILFTEYMVDYLFTQPPYKAKDVRLQFGVSDHAAIVCEIT